MTENNYNKSIFDVEGKVMLEVYKANGFGRTGFAKYS